MGKRCYVCGKEYGSIGWCDIIVPDYIWDKINPTNPKVEDGGLLCFNCIAESLEKIGLKDVPIKITSGPFAR